MKRIVFYINLIVLALLSACAQFETVPDKTVYSNMFPQELSRSQYYSDLGIGFYNESQWGKAVEYFKLSLLHDEENETAKYWLAKSYYQRQQLSLALTEVENFNFSSHLKYSVLQLQSDIYEKSQSFEKVILVNREMFHSKGDVSCLWKIFQMNFELGQFEEALANLHEIEKVDANLFNVHLARYTVYEKQNDLELAEAELLLAQKEKPYEEMTLNKLASIYQREAKWVQLYEVTQKYSRLHPFNFEISEKLSYAAIQLSKYDEALDELKKQKQVAKNDISLDFKIAHVLFLKKEFNKAEDLYAELYDLTKSDQSVYFISQIHLQQNDLSSAVNSLESLASWSEFYVNAQIQLAKLEWRENKNDFALNRLRRAQLLRPDSAELYYEYGQLLIWSNRYVEAIALIEQGIRSFPKNENLRIQAAYIHFKMNNMPSFQYSIEKAKELNPNNPEIYSTLAELWYEKEKPYSEIEYLTEKAVSLKSRNKSMKPLLAWALLKQDKLQRAVKMFEEFYDQNPNEPFYAEALTEVYNKSLLANKEIEYFKKAMALKSNQLLKSDFKFFKSEIQDEKTNPDGTPVRLPASLEAQ